MKNKFCLLIISLIMATTSAFAQEEGRLSGQVFDQEKRPMPGATVSLLKDSITRKTSITNKEGRFILENIQHGSYFLYITAVGYIRLESDTIIIQLLEKRISM